MTCLICFRRPKETTFELMSIMNKMLPNKYDFLEIMIEKFQIYSNLYVFAEKILHNFPFWTLKVRHCISKNWNWVKKCHDLVTFKICFIKIVNVACQKNSCQAIVSWTIKTSWKHFENKSFLNFSCLQPYLF